VKKRPRDHRPANKLSRPSAGSGTEEAGRLAASEDRSALAALAAITVAAAVLRFRDLFQPMDYDEAFTWVYFASRPLGQALSDYSLPNNHLFHTLLVHAAAALLGNHPWVLRLPAFLAGVALVPATHLLCRRFFEARAGVLAAALTACAPSLVNYSANARGYTMVCLAFVGTLGLAARITKADRARDWILFVAFSTLGLYTIPTMLYAFGGIVLWLAAELWLDGNPRRALLWRRTGLSVLAVATLTVLLYAPIWARSGWATLFSKGTGSPSWPLFWTTMAASVADVWRQWNAGLPPAAAVILGAAFVAGVAWHRSLSSFRVSPALAAFLFPAAPLLLQRVVPFTRVWLYLLPLYFSTAAAAVSAAAAGLPVLWRSRQATRRLVIYALVILVVAGMSMRVLASSRTRFAEANRVDWVSDFLVSQLQRGDLVAAHGAWATPIAYYLLSRDVAVERLSADWTLEVLVVVGSPKGASASTPHARRTFLVARAGDEPTLEAIRQKTQAVGASAELTVLRRFGTTTIYEVRLTR
jgi:4-amino-4-deoxy-L-arabinose transferase-like glycosyltransferase